MKPYPESFVRSRRQNASVAASASLQEPFELGPSFKENIARLQPTFGLKLRAHSCGKSSYCFTIKKR